jgi:hypothetical protein
MEEEHRKSRSREKAMARANTKKKERAQKKRAEMQNEPEDPKEPAVEATTDTVRKTQLWLLEFEIARVRKYADECMKNVATAITGMEEVSTSEYGKMAQGDESEVTIVKLHARVCQALVGIDALVAGGKILACVGETEEGESEELTEWQELLHTNNELREKMHEGATAQWRKDLNDAARKGSVYICTGRERGVHDGYGTARHVALEVIRWRAKILESKDKEIIPDGIGFVTTAEVAYPVPPEQRTDEQVQALVFKWLEDETGRFSAAKMEGGRRTRKISPGRMVCEQKGRKQSHLDHQGCGSAAKPVYMSIPRPGDRYVNGGRATMGARKRRNASASTMGARWRR